MMQKAAFTGNYNKVVGPTLTKIMDSNFYHYHVIEPVDGSTPYTWWHWHKGTLEMDDDGNITHDHVKNPGYYGEKPGGDLQHTPKVQVSERTRRTSKTLVPVDGNPKLPACRTVEIAPKVVRYDC